MGYREREIERLVSETVNTIVEAWRNSDGGWGIKPGQSSDVWSTAEVSDLLTMVSKSLGIQIASLHLPEILSEANEFLASQQNDDGGWGFESNKSDATGTELTMIALARSGQRRFHNNLTKALQWMEQTQNPDDAGWALKGRESVSSIFCTCFGCIALYALPEDLRTPIVEQRLGGLAGTFLLKARNNDGGWGDILGAPSVSTPTAYATYTLSTVFNIDSILESSTVWLKRHQNSDGGWGEVKGGEVEATSWTVMALLGMGKKPNSKRIRNGVDYLLNCRDLATGMWANQKDQSSTIWASYYALQALASYVMCCRETSDQRLSIWEQIKQILFGPKANYVLIPTLFLVLVILVLQFSNALSSLVGPYADMLGTVAAIMALLSTLWTVGRYFIDR